MTAPTVVTLSDEQAAEEVRSFLSGIGFTLSVSQGMLLATIFQRLYQEGVVAGMDRAIATVKAGHR